MDMGFGRDYLETLILESGDIQKQKGMGFTIGRLETDMKGSGNSV